MQLKYTVFLINRIEEILNHVLIWLYETTFYSFDFSELALPGKEIYFYLADVRQNKK